MATKKRKEIELDSFQPRELKAYTRNHATYLNSLQRNIVTLCCGAPGTGKTWMATGFAVNAMREGKIRRIVLCRPAVECGEKIGFLPGGKDDKLTPYMRPLFDALADFMSLQDIAKFQETGTIEICALGYMRGRTIPGSIIILDEAQNAKYGQLKMLLTRIGEHTKVVVNGDTEQSDLGRRQNGFEKVLENLHDVEDIGIVRMSEDDIMRPEIVKRIYQRL